MPKVMVGYDKVRVYPYHLENMSARLPEIIAQALDVPKREEARLKSEDVEIEFREFGRYDVHNKDIEIIVLASYFEERWHDLEGVRLPMIKARLKSFLNQSFFVYVRLNHSGFIEG